MQTDLFGQLDLKIYAVMPAHWWQVPLVQVMLALCLTAVVILIIFFMRKRAQSKVPLPQQILLELLYDAVHRRQQGKLTDEQALILLSSLIKKYTGIITAHDAVEAMTDQEWLSYSNTCAVFEPVRHECAQLEQVLSVYKFRGGCVRHDHMTMLFELVYHIIAQTASGRVPLVSGLFENMLKSMQT
jgi:hypothetical protein